jgi:hypothetical protein
MSQHGLMTIRRETRVHRSARSDRSRSYRPRSAARQGRHPRGAWDPRAGVARLVGMLFPRPSTKLFWTIQKDDWRNLTPFPRCARRGFHKSIPEANRIRYGGAGRMHRRRLDQQEPARGVEGIRSLEFHGSPRISHISHAAISATPRREGAEKTGRPRHGFLHIA